MNTPSKGRILVVDDEPRNVKVLGSRLRALGYEVLDAALGGDALRILASTPVDLVLADVMMPGIDGFELTRRIRADASLAGLPVVLITALDGTADRVRGFEAGADDFLTKPVNPMELELRVRSQVRLRRLGRELEHRSAILGCATLPEPVTTCGDVFVIDDDPRWSSLLVTRLTAAGYTIRCAADIASGVTAVTAGAPDVLIVDLLLPDGSGVDVIRRLREGTSPLDQRGPVILVVTSLEDPVQKLSCLRLGADDYLVKPVAPDEMIARLATHVRRSRASRAAHEQVAVAQAAAHTDVLTGLFNRRFLDEDLERRVVRAREGLGSFLIAMVDIDHFKRVNDTWGHPVGDRALRAVARCLRAGLRQSDLACRFGGEEMVLVLPSTSLAEACAVVERLRVAVAELTCPPLAAGALTISIGVAMLHPDESAAEVLARADRAVYQAKHNGRNRVEIAMMVQHG